MAAAVALHTAAAVAALTAIAKTSVFCKGPLLSNEAGLFCFLRRASVPVKRAHNSPRPRVLHKQLGQAFHNSTYGTAWNTVHGVTPVIVEKQQWGPDALSPALREFGFES